MSIHLMVVAAYMPDDVVTQGQKLALMKICDSADDETRLSRPGMKRLRAWVGVSEKRATTIVTELVGLGLIERVEVGKAGRRATYRVFPLGVPTIPSNEELEARDLARASAPKNPRKARSGVKRAAPSKPAMTHEDVDARQRAADEDAQEEGFHEWNPEEAEDRVPPVEPGGFDGWNPPGSTRGTPSFPSSSSVLPNPPTPAADAAGESRGCTKHRTPATSCRGCGTNPRAGRAAKARERTEAERVAQQGRMADYQADLARARQIAEERPGEVEDARRLARELARVGRVQASEARVPKKITNRHRSAEN